MFYDYGPRFGEKNLITIFDYSDEIYVPTPNLLMENNKIEVQPGNNKFKLFVD